MRKIAFVLIFFVVLGLAFDKLFGLNNVRTTSNGRLTLLEKNLLLSESDGLLPEQEARKIIRVIEPFITTYHTVGRNEWLEKIATEYGVPAISIRSTNNLEDPALRPNQRIRVQNKKGMVHTAKKDELLDSMIKAYEKLGSSKEKILSANSLDEVTYIKDGDIYIEESAKLLIPDAKLYYPFLSQPVHWLRISSRQGMRFHPILRVRRRHNGYDMVAPYGAPVYAGQAGTVIYSGWLGGYGNAIEIRHPTITTRYGHLSKIYVTSGQKVRKKQLIGRIGSSGLSTGPHLHFEVINNATGKSERPGKYLF